MYVCVSVVYVYMQMCMYTCMYVYLCGVYTRVCMYVCIDCVSVHVCVGEVLVILWPEGACILVKSIVAEWEIPRTFLTWLYISLSAKKWASF